MISPNFLIPSTILVAGLNLLTPFASKEDSLIRNLLLILTSSFFLINILITDWFFLRGVQANFLLFVIGNYPFAFNLEATGLIFLNLIGVLWICSLLYTTKYLVVNNIRNSNKFLFFLNFCVLAGILVALSSNLFTMFVCYEILTLATIPLIAHEGTIKVWKGLYRYLRILMISSLVLFLPAIVIIYTKIGHGNFIYDGFIENNFSKNQTIILLLMFIFGISKAALYPMQGWLPAAMVANYSVSALLHAVIVVKTGLFCIYKVLIYVFGLKYLQLIFIDFNWLLFIPIITILYSSLKAMSTSNIKIILAYSTINQLSIALLSAFMLTPKALAAAILHMVSHSFSKICLFYAAGNFYTVKNTYVVSDLYGIWKEAPKTSLILLIATLSLIGVPPFGGFISKFSIMLAAAEQNQILVMVVLAFSTLLSAIYMTKILLFTFKPSISDSFIENLMPKSNSENALPSFMIFSLYLCTLGVILFFILHKFLNQFLSYL